MSANPQTTPLQAPAASTTSPEPLPVAVPRWWTFAIFLIIWSAVAAYFYRPSYNFINWYTTILWTLPFGIGIIGIIGYFRSRPIIKAQPEKHHNVGFTSEPLDVVIMTIGADKVFDALTRVIRSTAHFKPHFTNYRVTIVTEQYDPSVHPHKGEANARIAQLAQAIGAELVVVPTAYQTENGTLFKARAAQYYLGLVIAQYGDKDSIPKDRWTYHLDDDTSIEGCTARKLAAFIMANPAGRRGSRSLGQGILTYKREESENLAMWLADSVRTADDILRFPATTAAGTPLAGLHGENLLERTWNEAIVGWDFGPNTTVEDSEHALHFCQQFPGQSAWFTARCFGSTPITAWDFIVQRGRWAEGMMALALKRSIPLRTRLLILHNMIVWATGILQPVLVVAAISFMIGDFNVAPITPWLAPLWVLSVTYTYWAYWEGLRQNALASGRKSAKLVHKVLLIPGIAYFSLLEGAGGTYGALRHLLGFTKDFHVVGKSDAQRKTTTR